VEEPQALGTAGAVANLRGWLDGRALLVVNADAWHTADLAPLVTGWDGERVRVLLAGAPEPPDPGPTSLGPTSLGPTSRVPTSLGPTSRVLGSLLPWSEVVTLPREPSGLFEASWRPHQVDGSLDVTASHVRFVDCGTPGDYLAANLASSGGESVVGNGAVVEGTLVRSVVWPGGVVRRGELLVDAIRVGESLTVRAGVLPGP
ncbi:MAG: nucleotidyl transferase, partial [Acidimicrobiales bacterium]